MKKCLWAIIMVFQFLNLEAQNVTWSEDIACIVYSHCSPCHNSEANSAFPLMSYTDVFNQRLAVELYFNTGRMPPAIHNSEYSKFANDRHLSQKEIDLIKDWARDLALEGDPGLAPAVPIYGKRVTTISNPEISFNTDYRLPDTISDHLRRCFIIKPSTNLAKKIQSIEVIPKNPSMVHAVNVFIDSSPLPIKLDDEDTGKGYSKFYGTGSSTFKPIYGWSLDSKPFGLARDMDLIADSGSYFIVQVQYTEEAAGLHDSTLINIKFDTGANLRRPLKISRLLAHDINLRNWPFIIQVDSTKQFFERYIVQNDMTILGISPHAHSYCDKMKVYALLPNKDTVPLLKIDDWDASWSELVYNFKKPVHLPAGTELHAFATYSNTVLNQHDPDEPLEQLYAGTDDHDEEMVFNFAYLTYAAGDENIIIDSLNHFAHHLRCEPVHNVTDIAEFRNFGFNFFPNPANKSITINTYPLNFPATIEIFNNIGQLCMSETIFGHQNTQINISKLKPGSYFIRFNSKNYTGFKMIVIETDG